MRFERVHVWDKGGNQLGAHAYVEVPGIGIVEFHSALSVELTERIREEVIAALRVKFGQKLIDKPTSAT